MPAPSSPVTIALIGNPNTGKSTLFSALAGVNQQTGNYPGVTVERRVGRMTCGGVRMDLVDLPGTYSLAPRSPDEMVAVDVLLGRVEGLARPCAVLAIIDAGNLERNLYLLSQVLELNLPVVVAANMIDLAEQRGVQFDIAALSRRLGVPVIPVQAHRRIGLEALRAALVEVASRTVGRRDSPMPLEFLAEANGISQLLAAKGAGFHGLPDWPAYLVERLLCDTSEYLETALPPSLRPEIHEALLAARKRLEAQGQAVPGVEAIARYGWIESKIAGVVTRPAERPKMRGDAIDKLLTHKLWGTIVFGLLMLLVFSAVFIAARPLMQGIDGVIGFIADIARAHLPDGTLRSLLVDGVIGGVGSVLVFLPQIMILFVFIGILEDCGYMARAAYLMDKLMVRVGLSGKSFIPLLSSFACAIPGIMATRVIENRRDRLATMLIAPLMSCSARLPVYTVFIAAFVPTTSYLGGLVHLQGLTLLAMYLIGLLTAFVVAHLLKRTILRGATPPFVMELPSYKWPSLRMVLQRVLARAWDFIYRAGTVILAVAIVIWALSYYPHGAEVAAAYQTELAAATEGVNNASDAMERTAAAERLAEVEHEIGGAYQRQSLLSRIGRGIEPAVRPLGWDWRIGCAVLASFPAREVVMGALGVIYNLGHDLDVESEADEGRLVQRLRDATWDDSGRPVYNLPVALSIMVFFALCAQCSSTLIVLRQETGSWKWPLFAFSYMTALAYLGALITYQVGSRL
jgi:ferrous iron transport protein B